jgi:hypothetical protein
VSRITPSLIVGEGRGSDPYTRFFAISAER